MIGERVTRHLQAVPASEPEPSDTESWEYPRRDGPGAEDMPDNDLAGAAANAATDDGAEGQQALLPKSVTRFVGMKLNTTNGVPELRDRVAYLVIGEVTGHTTEIMSGGEEREVAKVKVETVRQVEPGEKVVVE